VITILIDWISTTNKKRETLSNSTHTALLDGLWVECKGKNGYTLGQKHATGVRVYKNNDRPDMGQHTVYSGKTLSKIESDYKMRPIELLQYHMSEGHTVARLDLAIDFKGYETDVQDFVDALNNGNAVTRLRSATVVNSLTGGGQTLYIGSMKKRKNLIRIYDKGAENGTGADWVRVELQIMGKKATSTARDISDCDDFEGTVLSVIKSIVNFPTVTVWKKLMSDQLEYSMKPVSKQIGDTEKWIMKQVLPALARTIVLDIDFWVQFKYSLQMEIAPEIRDKVEW